MNGDWRLQGQERYLKGRTLRFARYERYREDWNHDHCEFCGAKFSESDLPDGDLSEGYVTEDDYRWICESCFQDFRVRFGWIVEG